MADLVVVGVDGGEPAARAARRAAEVAAALGARLHVVSAVERGVVAEFPERPGTALVTSGEVAESVALEAARAVGDLAPDVTTSTVQDKPATALVDEARRLEASLIVIGNRGAQGATRLMGSVARSVIAHAPCDVYVVKTF